MNGLQKEELMLLEEFDRICKKYDISYMLSSGSLLGAIRHNGFILWDDDIDICMKRGDYTRLCNLINEDLDDSYFFQTRKTDKDYFHPFAKLRSNNLQLKETSSSHLRAHQGVWLDIFPMDNIPDNLTERNIQRKNVMKYNKLISAMFYTFVSPEDKGVIRFVKSTLSKLNQVTHRVNFLLPYFYNKREKWLALYNEFNTEYTNMLTYNFNIDVYNSTLIANSSYSMLVAHPFESLMIPIPTNYDEILTLLYGDYMELPPEDQRVSNHFIIE